MPQAVPFTYQDLQLFADEKRRELVNGEIYVTPAPNIRHQRIVTSLFLAIGAFLKEHPLGEAFVSPVDVILSEEDDDVVEPDILYVANERASLISERGVEGVPDWVIEVTSPATRKRDFTNKLKLYQKYGVRLYWIIDPEVEMIHVWEGEDHRVYKTNEVLQVSPVPGLVLPVKDILA